MKSGNIEKICREYTDLSKEEIEEIENAAKSLPAMANLFGADAFIDCRMNDGTDDAIVVAEAKPIDGISSYKRTVVGLVATKEKEPAVYRGFHLGVSTKFMKATTQENAHVVQTVEPIHFKDRVIGVFIIEQRMEQINLGKENHGKNSHEEDELGDMIDPEKSSSMIDAIDEALIFINKENKVIFRNKVAKRMYKRLGFLSDIWGKDYKDICIVQQPAGECEDRAVSQEVKIGDYYFLVKTTRVGRKDVKYAVTIADITTRKLQEKELVLKSVAFKEMHHRVKNNLQTIVALLRLQRNTMASEEGKNALNDTISRILAISSTHQILVETEVETVKLNDIIAQIKDNTLLYYGSEDFELEVECYGGDFDVKFEKATSIALILNELMQNSIKYAFTGRKKGKISLIAMQRRADEVELIFIDDGKGFDTDKTSSGSMGWSIIRATVKERLNGHIKLKSDSTGTKVKIVFQTMA